jgi:O-acetylhomoserine (thiol)-lyase
MVDPDFYEFDTLALHAGQQPDPTTGARAVPIYQSTSFMFEDTDHAAGLFNLERAGHIYTRLSNPTTSVFEERVAALEGGVGALATASGMAALHLAVSTLVSSGEHIVASAALYGGSHNLLAHTLPRFSNINTTFVQPGDTQAFADAITDKTRLVFGESLGNPGLNIMDMPAVAAVAHEHGLPLLIDSTFATPYLFKPFDWGADLLYHSATKFIGGHGVALGGVLVDGGTFDWEGSDRFPTMTEPYDSYHGLRFAEEFGPAAFITRARVEGLRDFGPAISPANAFYLLQGLETLPLRMERHVSNTRAIVSFLNETPEVDWVSYPELEDHPDHERAKKMFPRGCGAIFSFGIKGGREAGRKFIESLQLFSHLANVGDAKSLIIHPGSTTHQTMDAEALKRAGIGEELIRMSVGLEDSGDLIDDLRRALKASQR